MALDNGISQASSLTDGDGEFLVCLPLGKNYALNVSKEKYIFHSENFALINRDAGKPYVLEIGLQKIPETEIATNTNTPVPASKPIVLRNVFFDTGSAELRNESFIELNRLKEMLEKNPTMKIQINGHTDNVGSESDNNQLSDGRAKAVYDFLIKNGIIADRLRYKGYGESQPIDTNDTIEGRQRNRRTEFVVLGS